MHFHSHMKRLDELPTRHRLRSRQAEQGGGHGAGRMEDGLQVRVVKTLHGGAEAVQRNRIRQAEALGAPQHRMRSRRGERCVSTRHDIDHVHPAPASGTAHPVRVGIHRSRQIGGGQILQPRGNGIGT